VPIFSLGGKRILEQCPRCQRHRVIKMSAWEHEKTKAFATLTEAMQSGTNRKEAIVDALGAACTFQDGELFRQVAELAAHEQDADVQRELGMAHGYFAQWPQAESAFQRSLAIADTPPVRHQWAYALLKQGKADEAWPVVQSALEAKDRDALWLIHAQIECFQGAGRHDEAIGVIDARDAAFPDLAVTKEAVKQRKVALKYQVSGKPLKATILAETSTGTHEGSPTGAKVAKWVGPLIAAGLLAWYLGAAWHAGAHRTIRLLNGWTKPYKVAVNSTEYALLPGEPLSITLAEGDVTIQPRDIDLGPAPMTCRVETPFYSRPFKHHSFVINPDRLAAVVWEKTTYGENVGPADDVSAVHIGDLMYSFSGIDYEFEEFPPQIRAEKGRRVVKQRVGVEPFHSTAERILATRSLPMDRQVECARQMVRLDPADGTAIGWLTMLLPPEEALAECRPHLAERPVRVDWHKIYQTLTETTNPNVDLRPEYRRLVEETKRAPDAVYLLGRIEDSPAADALYQEAVKATPPSQAAIAGLGFRCLSRGEFADALKWFEQAHSVRPDDLTLHNIYCQSLVAAKKFEKLADETRVMGASLTGFDDFHFHAIALVALGRRDEAAALPNEFLTKAGVPPTSPAMAPLRQALELAVAYAGGNRDAVQQQIGRDPASSAFAAAILDGKPHDAAAHIRTPSENSGRNRDFTGIEDVAIVVLAADKAGDKDLAAAQFKTLMGVLGKGDRDLRRYGAILAGTTPFDVDVVLSAVIDPEVKRALLPVFARDHKEAAPRLLELAKNLNFHRDMIGFCLNTVLEKN
jgi:tetratricopeptide (TPR) repeat protein